jgi:hypothetical protein
MRDGVERRGRKRRDAIVVSGEGQAGKELLKTIVKLFVVEAS